VVVEIVVLVVLVVTVVGCTMVVVEAGIDVVVSDKIFACFNSCFICSNCLFF